MTLYEDFIAEVRERVGGSGIFPWDSGVPSHDRAFHHDFRKEAIRRFGFAILTDEVIEELREFAPFIEVGAGTGYWAYEMQQADIDVIATDARPPVEGDAENPYGFVKPWTEVREMEAHEAAAEFPFRTLLIVWPSLDDDWAVEALRAFEGDRVVYVGEGYGGCTANAAFHDELEKRWKQIAEVDLPTWSGIRDYLVVYERDLDSPDDEDGE